MSEKVFKNPIEQANSLTLKPRDESYTKGMDDFLSKRAALLEQDKYLEPEWNALTDEIKKFRSGYEPAKIYTPREYLWDNSIDEFQIDRVRDDISLEDLWKSLQENGRDFYENASVDGEGFDSAVREKIFEGLADKLNLRYNDIYDAWLYGHKAPKKLN